MPEWYFLPFYAILRSITFDIWFLSAKLIGVIVDVRLDPDSLPPARGSTVRRFEARAIRPIYKQLFWLLVIDCLVLGYIGGKPPEGIFVVVGQIATLYYFAHFLVLLPLLSFSRETPRSRCRPASAEPVLKGGSGGPPAAAEQPMEKAQ